jgi:hypothetical protein
VISRPESAKTHISLEIPLIVRASVHVFGSLGKERLGLRSSLRPAANLESGFIQVLDRCRHHMVAHSIGEALEPLSAVLADPAIVAYRRLRNGNCTPGVSAVLVRGG